MRNNLYCVKFNIRVLRKEHFWQDYITHHFNAYHFGNFFSIPNWFPPKVTNSNTLLQYTITIKMVCIFFMNDACCTNNFLNWSPEFSNYICCERFFLMMVKYRFFYAKLFCFLYDLFLFLFSLYAIRKIQPVVKKFEYVLNCSLLKKKKEKNRFSVSNCHRNKYKIYLTVISSI